MQRVHATGALSSARTAHCGHWPSVTTPRCSFPEADVGDVAQLSKRMDGGSADEADLGFFTFADAASVRKFSTVDLKVPRVLPELPFKPVGNHHRGTH